MRPDIQPPALGLTTSPPLSVEKDLKRAASLRETLQQIAKRVSLWSGFAVKLAENILGFPSDPAKFALWPT